MKKVIISTVVAVLVLAVGITALVLGLIPTGINDKINFPDNVYIYSAQTNSLPSKRLSYLGRNDNERAKINKIFSAFNKGFQQKALAAIFKNEMGEGVEECYSQVSRTIDKNYKSEDKFTIVFEYKKSLTIKAGDKTEKFNYIFFEVNGKNERQEIIMGVSSNLSSDDGNLSVGSISYKFYYKAKANFNELYNCVQTYLKAHS